RDSACQNGASAARSCANRRQIREPRSRDSPILFPRNTSAPRHPSWRKACWSPKRHPGSRHPKSTDAQFTIGRVLARDPLADPGELVRTTFQRHGQKVTDFAELVIGGTSRRPASL